MTENIYWIIDAPIQDGKLDVLKMLAVEFTEQIRKKAGALAYE